MSLCAVDYRYGRPAMKALFSEESKLQRMLQVEAALAGAQAELRLIPKAAAAEITAKATTAAVKPARVARLEKETGHDVMAVVLALTEQCRGDAGRYVHLGATSNDITDTATALQLREAITILRRDLDALARTFAALAKKHRNTIMLGRTHGQAATPITFGLKMAVYALEVLRQRERLDEAERRVVVGKMSGAVGTGAAMGPKALRVQVLLAHNLGIGYEAASGQVVGRDRHAELVAVLANIAASCEKFCTEVRNLQRTEIAEAAEAFDARRQVGSSTMANKENPVMSENVCGLARIVRGLVIPAYEGVALWHERDLTNSSAERIIVPHALVLVDDILAKTARVYAALRVYPEKMIENIERTRGQVMAESVMIALVAAGMGRQEAHRLVRDSAMTARTRELHLREVLSKHKVVRKRLTAKELKTAMEPREYLGASRQIVDEVLRLVARRPARPRHAAGSSSGGPSGRERD